MIKQNVIAPIKITPEQNEWLLSEAVRTGNTRATIIRLMIQEKVEKKAKK